jgi:hypothetical protein
MRRLTPVPRASLHAQLVAQQDALDQLIRDVGHGVQSAAHYDDLERSAAHIGSGLRSAFRESRGHRA